jgi:molybdate transport system ATP-binding protein
MNAITTKAATAATSPKITGKFYLQRHPFCLDVDFECPAGKVTAITGPSGAGKSTILRCMAGLERGAVGHFESDGTVWQSATHFVAPHRRPFGFVFQRPNLFDHLNVGQNIGYGPLRQGVPRQQRELVIKKIAHDLRIDALLDRGPASLSGGQQQRVALARALVLEPRLLLMDEPMTGLDDTLKKEFLELLAGLQQRLRLTIVYVTHARSEISRIAHHVIRIEHGRVSQSLALTDYLASESLLLNRKQILPSQAKVIPVTIRSVTPLPHEDDIFTVELETGKDVLVYRMRHQQLQTLGLEPGKTALALIPEQGILPDAAQ